VNRSWRLLIGRPLRHLEVRIPHVPDKTENHTGGLETKVQCCISALEL
jgi:hypothetical protein